MQNAYIRMVLDVRERNTPNVIVVKKNDTARTLRIQLVDGNAAYTIGPECTAVMTALKADGTKLFNSCTVEENAVVYPFTEQTCSCAGRMLCEVRVIGSDGKMLTSASFTMVVLETAYTDGDTVSQGEADALALLVGQTTALRDELNRKLENGEFVGPQGPAGQEGKPGPTGPRGEAGPAGPRGVQGPAGPKGADGTVSFDQLTPQQIESLRGPAGPQGADGPPGRDGAAGPAGPAGKDGAAGPIGPQGPAGNTGPAGAAGPSGKSAYQTAVDGGFVGDEEAWLASLVGPRGEQGPQGVPGKEGAAGPAGPAGPQGPPADLMGEAKGPINMNGQPITGLNDPEGETDAARKGYVDAVAGRRLGNNLYDNNDFKMPVNQRMQTVYSAPGYVIDRWCIYTGGVSTYSLEIKSGYIQITADGEVVMYQRIQKNWADPTKTYTNVVKYLDNPRPVVSKAIISVIEHNYIQFNAIYLPTGGTVKIEWVDLFEGEYTADTVPAHYTPKYPDMLGICQWYFERIGTAYSEGLGNSVYIPPNSTAAIFTLPIAQKRIDTPTCIASPVSNYRIFMMNKNSAIVTSATPVTKIDIVGATKEQIYVRTEFAHQDGDFIGRLQRSDGATAAWIDVSAEL